MTSQGGAGDGAVTPAEYFRLLQQKARIPAEIALYNLLPEIAAVVEAVEKHSQSRSASEADAAIQDEFAALKMLSTAIAREQSR